MYIFFIQVYNMKKKTPFIQWEKSDQSKSRKIVFPTSIKKKSNVGPYQHYGLAEPLTEDNISNETLQKTQED